MAREYARIRISIAGDDHVEQLTPAAQWLYFRILIPDPKLSHCGVTDWRPKRLINKAAGLTLDYIKTAAAELERERFALFDEDTEEVLVRAYIRSEELLRNPKMAVAVADAYLGVFSRQLKAVIASEVHRDKSEHPDYSSWTHAISRESVELLLTSKTSDQVPYVDTFGNRNSDTERVSTTNQNGNGETNQKGNPDPGTETQSQTQADSLHLHIQPNSLQPAPSRGYVSTEGHQDDEPDSADPPPPHCSNHPGGTEAPCRACGDARESRKRWDRANSEQQRAQREAEQQAAYEAKLAAIALCELCDDDGYRGTHVCDHVDRGQTAAKGAALARAALEKTTGDE
ncbi:Uncharacterised protein [Mycobacteroides abscessus subsp. massiliense]|uniref:hypothetical protein n=1 Tax=Mycobacteroides abscessus TaxID=36809 RepID=UPI0009D0D8F7|nr:hypothetical protein [Mycobacteroides abscessus]SKH53824.1 Uncharacterised protein [Mycobacteroides abscessus subsp. massiliense]SKH84354.1 Uncharacterised protein [Mycobacteroides abscessus subsp. massiliense]SKK33474.1 Uncharacterised protein [Mycobacteroides abscessus subsp. massiliense]SKK45922.1 Uncharacterised protein [Mycobacteroides abscessus subsp. massiliense]SKL87502.1 Uncharacterised protein [Mycobacteroides abscessus subsp. massiliense]